MKSGRKLLGALLLPLLATCAMAQIGSVANDQRVESLLAQMTLDEKIGQMTQPDVHALAGHADIQKYFLGSILNGGGGGPIVNTPGNWLKVINEYESWSLKTRLKIPLLYGVDAVHGHNNVDGAVIFPHNIGLGATHNPGLVEQAERITALEVAGTGIRWAFAPCIAVAQDERWGRTYESFGDSPVLVSTLGAAAVRGFQGQHLSDSSPVLACAKHYVGDGGTVNGVDQGNDVCDEATLRKLYLPPYAAAIKAGVGSIMVSYSSWNGQKMSGNKHLLSDILKGEMGFRGFLVSDWAGIDQISPNYKEDVETSINAGLDMVMIPYGPGQPNNFVEFIQDLKQLVAENKIPMTRIDDAVRRILRVKFEMGLFENPGTDPTLTATIGSAEHRAVARECVRESVVQLKNNSRTLPLAKNLKHLAVVGAAADDIGTQCGGWTITWQGKSGNTLHGGTTILTAIRNSVGPGTQVAFSPDGSDLQGAEAVVVVVGEQPYAEMKGDRSDLNLDATDVALVEKAKSAGVPVVTVLISGRPLILGNALDASDAFLAAWLPGTEGQGVADVLFGDYKPTGKLPRPWPRNNDGMA
ncbi:MAG TPA: glycoside hydrolase family 3 N-terminal domain-containing protein, partial [Candidatus Acidoferrum sp.]|nr:glycoside hydrolase family 3 N-terminal domain-containing protein [Candidatus Acidoferrum sp.]